MLKAGKTRLAFGALFGVGLIVGALACSSEDTSTSTPPESDAGTLPADAGTLPADASNADQAADAPAKNCPLPASVTDLDGGTPQPWLGPEPEDGASCELPGSTWSDGCRCSKRCDCSDAGWACYSLPC